MATVRPGVMQKAPKVEGAKAVVEEFNPGFTPDDKYVEILEVVKSVVDTVDIIPAAAALETRKTSNSLMILQKYSVQP